MDGFDGDDFQLSQVIAEYRLSRSDLNLDIGFGYFDLKYWCLVAFPELKQEAKPQREESRFGRPVSSIDISAQIRHGH